MGLLVALASESAPTQPSAQATAMAVIGCCSAENWERVIAAGGLPAAVHMLRRSDTTLAGRERAVGLLNVLAMALPAEQRSAVFDAGCLEALHGEMVRTNSSSTKANQRAAELLAFLAAQQQSDSNRTPQAVDSDPFMMKS